ncbi:amino acid racemase [Deinococcus malanensis]|uniref:amino acid racemase n=1 Tax=Deinococcus malanensis TaxID=1706855 RepID=UPI003630DC60
MGQAYQMGLDLDHVVCASGSAGTHAGLLVGLTGNTAHLPLTGINVRRDRQTQEGNVHALAQQTAELVGVPDIPREAVRALDEWVGPGYSLPTAEMTEAVQLLARLEGILLDPVYTGKAMAGLIGLVRRGEFEPGQKVLFVHTGGRPRCMPTRTCCSHEQGRRGAGRYGTGGHAGLLRQGPAPRRSRERSGASAAPDRQQSWRTGPECRSVRPGRVPGPVLAQMARGLQASGADFLVMVCNTAHAFEDDILNATSLPFVSLIEETRDAVLRERPALRRVGLLATNACLDAGLYQSAFAPHDVRTLTLEGASLERFMELLYRIKAGNTGPDVRAEMRSLALELVDAGAEVLVAGCTEVPLVLGAQDVPAPLVNSTDVLVERTLQYARGLAPLPERSVETPA